MAPQPVQQGADDAQVQGDGQDDRAAAALDRMGPTALDIHAEDRAVIEAGQRGLSSGALKHIHFQSQEVLCRHLFHIVDQAVRTYQAELRQRAAQ